MKKKLFGAVLLIAMLSFAFHAKAATVTINPGISYVTFYPTQGGTPYVLYSTGDVPDGIYTAVAQVTGSFALFGYVNHNYYAYMYSPSPYIQQFSVNSYPDNDPNSPTFGEATFYSVTVDSISNNVFSMGY